MSRVLKQTESSEVWRVLPAEVAVLLRPQIDQAVAEMIDAIQRDVPEYARPLDATYTDAISRAVRHSVEQFCPARLVGGAGPLGPAVAGQRIAALGARGARARAAGRHRLR
jgi:hypothetical protein